MRKMKMKTKKKVRTKWNKIMARKDQKEMMVYPSTRKIQK